MRSWDGGNLFVIKNYVYFEIKEDRQQQRLISYNSQTQESQKRRRIKEKQGMARSEKGQYGWRDRSAIQVKNKVKWKLGSGKWKGEKLYYVKLKQ